VVTVRAQAHTLEAFVAALLVLSGIGFALQATAVTPLSASTSNQHIGNQERAAATGLLDAAEANGTLRGAVVYWNTSNEQFAGSTDGQYSNGGPPNAFGDALEETFGDRRTAFNVELAWFDANRTERDSTLMVDMGRPSDDAVSTSRNVVLYNDTRLTAGPPGNVSAAAANDSFYMPDAARGERLFNVVEVRIVVWRI
jgi:hypothetical protein